jgi:hypothetical protein
MGRSGKGRVTFPLKIGLFVVHLVREQAEILPNGKWAMFLWASWHDKSLEKECSISMTV